MQSVLCHTLLDVLFAFADPLVFTSLPTLYISSSVTIHAEWAHPTLVADGTNIATRHVVLGAHAQVVVQPHIQPAVRCREHLVVVVLCLKQPYARPPLQHRGLELDHALLQAQRLVL